MIARLLLLTLMSIAFAACSGNGDTSSAEVETEFLEGQLAALAVLPRPAGVEAKDWGALKAELSRALEQRLSAQEAEGAKLALAAPATLGARMELYKDGDSNDFLWFLRNPGDYDQNGEVNISDLTPLAAHFGAAVPETPDGPNSIEAVVDGDGNGLITIADVTPIGANLGRRITEFRAYYGATQAQYPEEDYAAEPLMPAFASLPVSQFEGVRSAQRIWFRLGPIPPNAAGYYWIRPHDNDGTSGTASTPLPADAFTFPAGIDATPFAGSAPLVTTLTAEDNSYTENYEWDPEGDGTFFSTADNSSIIHSYPAPGLYNATVRMTSLDNVITTAVVQVNVGTPASWRRYALPSTQSPGFPRAIAINRIDGETVALVSFNKPSTSNDILSYFIAGGATGSSWSLERFRSSTSGAYRMVTLHGYGGKPGFGVLTPSVVQFERGGTDWLKNSGWPSATVVDFVSDSEWFLVRSIAQYPFAVWHDPATDQLEFAAPQNLEGSSWNLPQHPAGVADTGTQLSMAQIGNNIGISYFDENGGGGALRYVDTDDLALPPDFNAPVAISFSTPLTCYDSLVALPGNVPALVYHNCNINQLRIRWASDATGDTWPGVNFGFFASTNGSTQLIPRAIVAGDRVHAFWRVPESGELWHCSASAADPEQWDAPEVVASAVHADVWFYPADIEGYPAVGYASAVDGSFRFAIKY